MIVMRILVNAFIMAAELAAVAGVAALGYHYPFIFAGATAALSFVLLAGPYQVKQFSQIVTITIPYFWKHDFQRRMNGKNVDEFSRSFFLAISALAARLVGLQRNLIGGKDISVENVETVYEQ